MGVAEKDHLGIRVVGENFVGIVDRKDVGVFVERRAVADVQVVVDRQRAERHIPHVPQIGRGQPFGCPAGGRQGRLIKIRAVFELGDHLVVIAADDEDRAFEVFHRLDDLIGPSAVTHQIPKDESGVEALATHLPQHRCESVPVAMHVRKDEIAHCFLLVESKRF